MVDTDVLPKKAILDEELVLDLLLAVLFWEWVDKKWPHVQKNVTWGMPKSCKNGEILDSFRLYEGNPINLHYLLSFCSQYAWADWQQGKFHLH